MNSSEQVVVRFPPSPTGRFHLGSARTALFNFYQAQRFKGKLIFRIEDTDRARSEEKYVDDIKEGMSWLGMSFDEGPFYQSKRTEEYRAILNNLIENEAVYKCTCSSERLTQIREQAMVQKLKPKYDKKCLKEGHEEGLPFVWRIKMPEQGEVSFVDKILGQITFDYKEFDDFIIWRSDDTPTYHLTVVADDYLMGINQVIRGQDHINNTIKQIQIYKALKVNLPEYAHIPMVLGKDKSKLSKRHGAKPVLDYRTDGILKEALLNMLIRLGWSHGDQELFSDTDIKDNFDISKCQSSNAVFDDDKILFYNKHYIAQKNQDELKTLVKEVCSYDWGELNEVCSQLFDELKIRASTLWELKDICELYFSKNKIKFNLENKKIRKTIEKLEEENFDKLEQALNVISDWADVDSLKQSIDGIVEKEFEGNFGQFGKPVRLALTGALGGPDLALIFSAFGQQKVMSRIKALKAFIKS